MYFAKSEMCAMAENITSTGEVMQSLCLQSHRECKVTVLKWFLSGFC